KALNMDVEHLVMILVPIIAAVGGWVSNIINNRTEKEDLRIKRIETIINNVQHQYKSSEERLKYCEKRYNDAWNENMELKRSLYEYRLKLEKVEKEKEKED